MAFRCGEQRSSATPDEALLHVRVKKVTELFILAISYYIHEQLAATAVSTIPLLYTAIVWAEI